MEKTDRYLQHMGNKRIYRWNPVLAQSAEMVEVSAEQAYPEQFVPEPQQKRVSKLKLTTEGDIPDEPKPENLELNADASRNLLK